MEYQYDIASIFCNTYAVSARHSSNDPHSTSEPYGVTAMNEKLRYATP